MARSTEEPKLTLPIGHPQAGYVSPDLSGTDGVGTLPDDEQDAHDERNAAYEEEVAAVADAEDKVAKQEAVAAATEEAKVAAKSTKAASSTESSS